MKFSDRFYDALVAIIAIICLTVIMCHQAKAEDYEGPHHFNVVFSKETTFAEVAWQALNVVDAMQTVYIADHPDQYQEVGQAGAFVGNHLSHGQAIAIMAVFAVVHYGVSLGIENLVQQNPDYRVLQRTWQYTTLGYKVYTVENNHRIGIKP